MTQTIGATNTVNGTIHLSADGVTWLDVSGSANKLDAPPQVANVGSAASLDGKYEISTEGKLAPIEVTVTGFYTELANEIYDYLRIQNAKAGRPLWVRWSPKGTYNAYRYTTANGAEVAAAATIIEMPLAPSMDAGQAAPTMIQFKVRCETVVRTVVTPSASLSPSGSASPSGSGWPAAARL